jgi:hypothetical protein
MYRSIRIALSAGIILLTSAAVPPMLPDSTTMSLSGSALAQKTPTTKSTTTMNTSKSNNLREGGPGKGQPAGPAAVTTIKSPTLSVPLIDPLVPAGPAAVTTIKSTKSNGSLKTTQPGKGQQPPGPAEATTVKGIKAQESSRVDTPAPADAPKLKGTSKTMGDFNLQ